MASEVSASLLVERNGSAKEGVDDIRIVVQLLVNHQSKDAHLGSTAVVQLDGRFGASLLGTPAVRILPSNNILLNTFAHNRVAVLQNTDEHKLENINITIMMRKK